MSLLPANTSAQLRAIETASARIDAVPVPVGTLWNPETCPGGLLSWLAWTLSVDTWEVRWSEPTKRGVLAASVGVHRRKGTVGSVKAAIRAAGLGDAQLLERNGALHDGALSHDGSETHHDVDHWAEFRVVLEAPMTNDQAAQVRRIVGQVAPAHCHLVSLDFRTVPMTYDGSVRHDGAYNYGEA